MRKIAAAHGQTIELSALSGLQLARAVHGSSPQPRLYRERARRWWPSPFNPWPCRPWPNCTRRPSHLNLLWQAGLW